MIQGSLCGEIYCFLVHLKRPVLLYKGGHPLPLGDGESFSIHPTAPSGANIAVCGVHAEGAYKFKAFLQSCDSC